MKHLKRREFMKTINLVGSATFFVSSMIFSMNEPEKIDLQHVTKGQNDSSTRLSYEDLDDTFFSNYSSTISTTPYPSSGSGSSSTSTRKVDASDLSPNIEVKNQNYGGLVKGHLKSEKWTGANLIGRYMDIEVTDVVKVTGVYSHFPEYFDYNILKSGSVKSVVEQSNTYCDTISESMSFSTQMNYRVEAALEAKASINVISSDLAISTKSGSVYNYDCKYTRTTTQTYRWTDTFSISQATADYCPEGYTLSIGKQGTYYVVTGNYQETSIWWWGDYPTQGTSRESFTAVIAKPQNFNSCFVYKKKTDSNTDYYNKK